MKYWTSISFPRKGTLYDIINFYTGIILYFILYSKLLHDIFMDTYQCNLSLIMFVLSSCYIFSPFYDTTIQFNMMKKIYTFIILCTLLFSLHFTILNDYGFLLFMLSTKIINYGYYKNNLLFISIGLYIIYMLFEYNYSIILFALIRIIYTFTIQFIINNHTNYNPKIICKKINYCNFKNIMIKISKYTNLFTNIPYNYLNDNVNNEINNDINNEYYLTEKKNKTFKIIKKIGMNTLHNIIICDIVLIILLTSFYKLLTF